MKYITNEREVKNEVGRLFANENVSFYGWEFGDITINPNGNCALIELHNFNSRKEINIKISTKLQPLFISKGFQGDRIYKTLREVIKTNK